MAKKQLQSADGSLVVPYENVQNVCICVVIYPLLQYLLLNDLEICKHHTAYILDESISAKIRGKLPAYTFPGFPQTPFYKFWRKIVRAFQALTRDIRHPYLKKATIYAQDHDIVSILIGKHDYYLLQDAPNIYTALATDGCVQTMLKIKKQQSLRGKIETAIYGVPFVYHHGNNDQCKKMFLTEENDCPILKEKDYEIRGLKELWGRASEEKKQFILDVFDISKEDLQQMQSRPIVFFSQPMADLLSEQEYVEFIKKIFSHYDHSLLLIKTHPRDHFNYRNFFPDILVFDKPVNVELLFLFNFSFQKAVTISSAAVFSLPETIELDWYGPNIHPKIYAVSGSGETKLPRSYNQMSL